MRRAARTDANQSAVVEALRAVGASVTLTYQVGAGYPDLSVGFRGATFLLEVKTAKGTLTTGERQWLADWRGHTAVVRSVDEALQAIGALRSMRSAMGCTPSRQRDGARARMSDRSRPIA